jgi:hypothetical protein
MVRIPALRCRKWKLTNGGPSCGCGCVVGLRLCGGLRCKKVGRENNLYPGCLFFFRCVCGGMTCVGEVKSESEKVLREDRMVFIL